MLLECFPTGQHCRTTTLPYTRPPNLLSVCTLAHTQHSPFTYPPTTSTHLQHLPIHLPANPPISLPTSPPTRQYTHKTAHPPARQSSHQSNEQRYFDYYIRYNLALFVHKNMMDDYENCEFE